MIETGWNHYEVVKDALDSGKTSDEQTFASITILHERLERLKKCHKLFSGIKFSPDVEQLIEQQHSIAIS